jgi:hypothetical protein
VGITRRRFTLAAAAAMGVGPTGARAAPAGPKAPSAAEIDDVLAFAEVLVGDRPLTTAERDALHQHVQRRLRQGSGYYVELYRTTAALLTRLAGGPFSTLGLEARIALVARQRLGVASVPPGETLGAFAEEVREVRTRAVPDLIGAYYASEAGWAVVGYAAFPGRCSDPTRYTAPEP